jgi:hypothetical protein
MNPVSEPGASRPIVGEGGLAALLARLEALAGGPTFQVQRQIAMSRVLRLYATYDGRVPLSPLPEEVGLAEMYLFADYYPDDGQLSLTEQVRDMIEVHVPEEERVWLDPLRHSCMDLLDIVAMRGEGTDVQATLRSLGSAREFQVAAGGFKQSVRVGQAVLTRLVHQGDRTVCPGPAVVLSASSAQSIYKATDEWRREMEAEAGSFELGEWEEFAKRYGYVLLWNVAQARLQALLQAEAGFRYRTLAGQPYLHVLALYDHHEWGFAAAGLTQCPGWEPDPPTSSGGALRVWVQRGCVGDAASGETTAVVVRLTLTPSQLIVECDSRDRLEQVKHTLASTFGFSLHFRGEFSDVPSHRLLVPNLDEERPPSQSLVVTPEQEQRLLRVFLESVYLEWVDLPSPSLGGETPRHAAASPAARAKVAALIDEIERHDLGVRRMGKPAYDYNVLRSHVGLEEAHP